jgi:hypothetical protein
MQREHHPDFPLALSIEAAKLLGRWTILAQRHADGCSCCPGGLGNVAIAQVERSVMEWLRDSHPALEGQEGETVAGLLRACIERRPTLPRAGIDSLFADLGRAIAHLEHMQSVG